MAGLELCALIEALSVSLILNIFNQVFEHLQQRSQDAAQNDNGVSAALELSYTCLAVSLEIPTHPGVANGNIKTNQTLMRNQANKIFSSKLYNTKD